MVWTPKAFAKRGVSADAGIRHGFRSGLESATAKLIEQHGHPVLFETFKIPYVVPEHHRHYTPDFELANGIIIETKGIFDLNDRAKHLLIQAEWPQLDIRFVFSNPNARLYKGSPTTYATWCEERGFRWAGKVIPEAWYDEPGPAVKPAVVLMTERAGPPTPRKPPTKVQRKRVTAGKGKTNGKTNL
jgi:hypothetical protein